jgi:hypothetical protein
MWMKAPSAVAGTFTWVCWPLMYLYENTQLVDYGPLRSQEVHVFVPPL